jgi:murein DD-endopeptidase MepM/ murein hydrolase activator NlpD
VRVAIVPLGRREAAVNARLGQQATGEEHTVAWPRRARLRPGRYTLRLHATDAAGNTLTRRAHQSGKAVITVAGPQRAAKEPKDKPEPPAAAPAPAPTPAPVVNPAGTFPVAGPHTFGGEDADFGSARDGHVHQGQDVTASEGTPVLAPTAGTIIAVDYQRGGAGYYVAMASADGRDFFFAHLQKGSTAVTLGQAVAAGTPLGRVGSTGSSTGPHLHFEIWEDGWQRGHPVDPLAQLRAWDR